RFLLCTQYAPNLLTRFGHPTGFIFARHRVGDVFFRSSPIHFAGEMLTKLGRINLFVASGPADFDSQIVILALPDSHDKPLLRKVEWVGIEQINLARCLVFETEGHDDRLDRWRRKQELDLAPTS